MTPTERTLKWLKEMGWPYAKCEHWNPFAHIRQDLFGLFDYLALDDKQGVLGIQISGYTGIGKHITKMQTKPVLEEWKKRGNRALVIGWRKAGTPARWESRQVYL